MNSITSQTTVPATEEQKDQLLAVVTAAIERFYTEKRPTRDGVQRLLGQGGVLQDTLVEKAQELSLGRYANEEVPATATYPEGFTLKDIKMQVELLSELFQLDAAPALAFIEQELPQLALPEWADDWGAIVVWEEVGKTYTEAFEKALDLIASKRAFYNYRKGQLGPKHLKQEERTVNMIAEIRKFQKGAILIIPIQFGKRHAGRSVRRAQEMFDGNELGLGAFHVACLLLTHPDRLVAYENLWIDCSGDKYAPGADGVFSRSPFWNFNGDELEFGTDDVRSANGHCGSASGSFPQKKVVPCVSNS